MGRNITAAIDREVTYSAMPHPEIGGFRVRIFNEAKTFDVGGTKSKQYSVTDP